MESLKQDLAPIKKMLEFKNYEVEAVRSKLKRVLESFSENLFQPLVCLPEQGFTQLDKRMREHRLQELMLLRKECDILLANFSLQPLIEIVTELEEYISCLKSIAHEVKH